MIDQIIEFLTPARIINILFWLFTVVVFITTTKGKKKVIWEGLIGPDNKLQPHEIAAYYWCLLFPAVVFLQMLVIITDLDVRESHLELFTYIEGALTLIAMSVILKKSKKEDEKESL